MVTLNIRSLAPVMGAFFLLFCSAWPAVAADVDLARQQVLLSVLNQELQATYQELQMIETARRAIMGSAYAFQQGLSPRSYDENAANLERAQRQDQALAEREERLLARMQEIDARKEPVLERISQLANRPASTSSAAERY